MNATDPNLVMPDAKAIAHNCGKRLRKLTDSKGWSSREMRVLRKLFDEFAEQGTASTNDLRQLVELVGVRPSDQEALQHLSTEHVPLIWCGYYGAPIPDQHHADLQS